ncbi:MAG TPA: hypothetical protein VHE13_11800 [Opitutus sp.]|nr:hypothetical protein [Opitutus sp.]
MTASVQNLPAAESRGLATLRAELADLAFRLEREGRCDAADVVMVIDGRVRELIAAAAKEPALTPFLS